MYQHAGYKSPFIFCIVLAGIDLILRLFLVERKNNPPEWFEKETIVDSTSKKDDIESTDMTISSQEEKEEIKNQKPVTYLRLLKQHRLLAGMLMAFSNAVVIGTFEVRAKKGYRLGFSLTFDHRLRLVSD